MSVIASKPIADTPLAQWLEAQLIQRQWSRREASMNAGLSPISFQNYVQGSTPDSAACRAMAKLFGVEPVFVMKLAGHLVDEDFVPSSDRQTVIAAIHGLSSDQIADVTAYVEQFRKANADRKTGK
jgi:lambda repressor-like predicted transcriptional regulator